VNGGELAFEPEAHLTLVTSVEGLPSVHAARGTYGAKVVDNQDGTFSVVVFPKPGLSIRLCLVK